MLTYDQIAKHMTEIMSKDPQNEKLAESMRDILAKAEKQTMRLLDHAMHYGSAFTKVHIPEDQKEAVKAELMKPGACVEIGSPVHEDDLAKLSDELMVAFQQDEQDQQAWSAEQASAKACYEGTHTNAIAPLPYKSVSAEMLELMKKARGNLWADFPGHIYKKEFIDTFNRDAAGLKIRQAAAMEARIVAARAERGYEALGGKPLDKPSLGPDPRVVAALKQGAAIKAGEPLCNAITALNNNWRSDGRPHKYEVD